MTSATHPAPPAQEPAGEQLPPPPGDLGDTLTHCDNGQPVPVDQRLAEICAPVRLRPCGHQRDHRVAADRILAASRVNRRPLPDNSQS